MTPYSIPLWTILTRWPAPFGPQCRYPCSDVPLAFSRPGVGDVAAARCKRGEDRIEMLHRFGFAADHHAIAALQTPDAAARADVNIVDAFCGQLFGAANIIDVVGIAAVDQDIAALEMRQKISNCAVYRTNRHHEPNGTWLCELFDELRQRSRA